jgi:regulatory protein
MPFSRPRKQAVPLSDEALYGYAVKALARQMRSVAEVKRLMRTKVEPGEAGETRIAAVVARLQEQHYLDDASFAAAYIRLRQENESFGKRRVEQELGRKGIAPNLIASSVEAAYPAASEEELARCYLARKRIGKPGNAKETARLIRRLVSAGFSIGILMNILKNWDVEVTEEDLALPEEEPMARDS